MPAAPARAPAEGGWGSVRGRGRRQDAFRGTAGIVPTPRAGTERGGRGRTGEVGEGRGDLPTAVFYPTLNLYQSPLTHQFTVAAALRWVHRAALTAVEAKPMRSDADNEEPRRSTPRCRWGCDGGVARTDPHGPANERPQPSDQRRRSKYSRSIRTGSVVPALGARARRMPIRALRWSRWRA